MSIILAILSKHWMQLLGGAAVILLLMYAHHAVYQSGWNARDVDWKADTAKREEFAKEEHSKAVAAAQEKQLLMGQAVNDQYMIRALQQRKAEVEFINVAKARSTYEEHHATDEYRLPAEFVCVIDAFKGEGDSLSEAALRACGLATGTSRISTAGLLRFATDVKTLALKWRNRLIDWENRERVLSAIEQQ
jgi:hypothetical protein